MKKQKIYNLIGYGSLISHKSFKPKNYKTKPVIVKGYKRIFNLSENSKEKRDVLNLKKSKFKKFNAILFKVNQKELDSLAGRETGYNLQEVWCYDFKTKKKLTKAWMYIDYIVSIDKSKRLPDKNYFKLCRDGAYKVSEDFGKMWDKTTYTSEGKKISRWIKNHPDYQ